MRARAFALSIALGCAAPAVRAQVVVGGPVTTEVTAVVGERVTIPVAVSMVGAPGIALGSYAARFTWNPALMRLVGVTPGTFAAPVVNADTAAQGIIRFAAASSGGATGVPVIANVTLEVLSIATADTFRVNFPEMDAAVTFQDLLPFLTVTNGSFCAGAVYGDANRDGVIQALDAQVALMRAVGMTVTLDTIAADVDADGAVTTRDALVILSSVIGLDVSAFRIGTFISGVCTAGAPAALNVIPAAMTLAAGDTFRVSAQVRDTAGNLLAGKQLAWSTSDPLVAVIDSTGTVRALTDGTVTITGAVSPALAGTGTLTVGPRHRWRVDPANAQGALAEVGSDAYPFSTIAAAVAHAAPGDTIAVATARYGEPLAATAGLVFLGDTGATGVPVIATPNRPAGLLSGSGRYVVRRFRVEEAQAGLTVRGDTADLESLAFVALRGEALRVTGAARVSLRGVTVDGVRALGLGVDSARVIRVAGVRVAGVEPTTPELSDAVGLFARADSVFLDTVLVAGVAGTGVLTRDAQHLRARRLRVEFVDRGLRADSSATVELLDSSRVRLVGSGAAVESDFDTLRVVDAVIEDVQGPGILLGPAWFGFHAITITGTRIERVGGAGVQAPYFGPAATLRRVTVRGASGTAIAVASATLTADSILIDGAGGDGISVPTTVRLTLSASTLQGIQGNAVDVGVGGTRADITGTRIADVRGSGVIASQDTLVVQGDTLEGVGNIGVAHDFATLLQVRDSRFRRLGNTAIYSYSVSRVEVARVQVDSATDFSFQAAIEINFADTARVDSSSVRNGTGQGIYVYSARRATVTHDTLTGNYRNGSPLGGASFNVGVVSFEQVDTSYARRNVLRDNFGTNLYVDPNLTPVFARIDSNTIRSPSMGVYVPGGPDSVQSRVEVVGNAFVGRLDGLRSYQVYAVNLGQLVVTGNTFDSIAGYGIYDFYGDTLRAEGNTFGSQHDRGTASYGLHANRVGTAVLTGNAVTCTGPSLSTGIYVYRATLVAGSNTVTACARGITAEYDFATPDSATLTGNRATGAGIMVAGLTVRGNATATFSGNVVTGGVFSEGALGALGQPFNRAPRVTLNQDTVTGGAGRGIVLQWVDTVDVAGARVSGLASLFADTTSEAALWARNVFGPMLVHGGAFVGHADAGILLSDTARNVTIDTNLVADNLGSGLVLRARASSALGVPDTVRARFNSFRRNAPFGVRVDSINTDLQSNNIEGNAFGLRSFDLDSVDARNSWWGDAVGPACAAVCTPGSTGDSLLGVIGFSPAAADTVLGTPPGAPPAFGPAGLPALRAVARPRNVPLPRPVAPAPRPVREALPATPDRSRARPSGGSR